MYESWQRKEAWTITPVGMMKHLSDLTAVKIKRNEHCLKEAEGGVTVSVMGGTGSRRSSFFPQSL